MHTLKEFEALIPAEKIDQMAQEIKAFLEKNDLWQGVILYYNGKALSQSGLEDKEPTVAFEYVADPHILSMSFDGSDLCGCLNFYNEYGAAFDDRIQEEFLALLENYGTYYELGHHWNLSLYHPGFDYAKYSAEKKQTEDTELETDQTDLPLERSFDIANRICAFLVLHNFRDNITIYCGECKFEPAHTEYGMHFRIIDRETLPFPVPSDIQSLIVPPLLSMRVAGRIRHLFIHVEEVALLREFESMLSELGIIWHQPTPEYIVFYPEYEETAEANHSYRRQDCMYIYGNSLDAEDIPDVLLRIQRHWTAQANQYGDQVGDIGSCVLGAGFTFRYGGKLYKLPPRCRYQGSVIWEHFVPEIRQLLQFAGARDITYDWGNMD